MDGGTQPQPAFSPGFNVCGVQCSAGLQFQRQRRCSLLASPHHPARPDNRLRFYYTLKVSCLGWVPKVCRASGRQPPACSAEPRAWLDPALASGPLSPQGFFGPQ